MKNPSKITPSKVGIKRGPWTPEEDELLSNYITREGQGRWRTLPRRAGLLRCGKSCRLRWMNYLRPSVKRGQIAPDEEDLILRLHRLLGNRWSLIAGRIPGRTDNEIKNYWNTHIKRKLLSRGVDPQTHRPIGESYSNVSNSSLHANGTNKPEIVLFCNHSKRSNAVYSTEEANSSGTSEVVEQQQQKQQFLDLNLDLSISLPFQSNPPSTNTAESIRAVARRFQTPMLSDVTHQ